MAINTTNYGLKKPDETEFYNIQDFNGNADLIDAIIYAIAQRLSTAETNASGATSGLASHLADTNNPHKVTLAQLGAAASHTHDASAIISGILSVLRGGTVLQRCSDHSWFD